MLIHKLSAFVISFQLKHLKAYFSAIWKDIIVNYKPPLCNKIPKTCSWLPAVSFFTLLKTNFKIRET